MRKIQLVLFALLLGCVSTPQVVEVVSTHRQEVVNQGVANTVRVRIDCIDSDGTVRSGGGSGVYLRHKDGRQELVTAAHVMAPKPDKLCVWTVNGEVLSLDKYDHKNDLALVSYESDEGRSVRLSELGMRRDDRILGAPIFIVGYPYVDDGPELRVTHGRIQSFRKDNRWTTNAEAWYGNSGGPVFDHRGDIVGILIQIRAPSILFTDYVFVPSKYIVEMLECEED